MVECGVGHGVWCVLPRRRQFHQGELQGAPLYDVRLKRTTHTHTHTHKHEKREEFIYFRIIFPNPNPPRTRPPHPYGLSTLESPRELYVGASEEVGHSLLGFVEEARTAAHGSVPIRGNFVEEACPLRWLIRLLRGSDRGFVLESSARFKIYSRFLRRTRLMADPFEAENDDDWSQWFAALHDARWS